MTGLLTILAALIPVFAAVFMRWFEKRGSPAAIAQRKHDEISKAVAQGNQVAVNVSLDDMLGALARLRSKTGGNISGQAGNPNACGTDLPAGQ